MDCSTPGSSVLQCLPEFAQTHVLWWCCLTTSSSAASFSFSRQPCPVSQFFASGGQNVGSFSSSPSNDYSGLISFRMDWLDLLAVQGTLKSLLQHHSSKASVLRRSAFFVVQLLKPYMTTGKTIALTMWTFVSKVMSLFSSMLSRLVIVCLPRSKLLWISWLQSLSAVILESKKIESVTASTFPLLFAMKWWDRMPWYFLVAS